MFLLPFIIIAPLLSFLILMARRNKLSFQQATLLGLGSSFVSALILILATISYFISYGPGSVVAISVFDAIKIGDFNPSIGFSIDGLSLMLAGIVTWVGFLIQLFATWNMQDERQFSKIFAYLNMLLVSLLTLILADNLFLMYVGWEGAAMSSYLLYNHYMTISHDKILLSKSAISSKESALKKTSKVNYIDDLQNTNKPLLKMMGMTRIADVAVLLGMLLLYRELNTLDIAVITQQAGQVFQVNDSNLVFIVTILVIGAITKSAQLPLHTWATSSSSAYIPAPVLAILHSVGLLVGAYLIARLHTLFILTPNILLWWVGTVGAITTVLAALCALAQTDIKRIIAFSSMTQMGFVFLAMGVGAWQLAVFQMMTFALTQALLFLSTGAVIASVTEDDADAVKNTNIFQIGGLKNSNPVVFYSFLMAIASLNAIPFMTLGYYSKLGILWETYIVHPLDNQFLIVVALLGVLLTAFYSFRLVWCIFFNSSKVIVHPLAGFAYQIPLILLALLTSCIGYLISPNITGILINTFPNSVGEILVMTGETPNRHMSISLALVAILLGFALGWLVYVKNKGIFAYNFKRSIIGKPIYHWCYHGLGFNDLYDWILLKPMLFIARLINRTKPAQHLSKYMGKPSTSALITEKNITSFDAYLICFIIGLVFVLTFGVLTAS